MVRHFFFSKLFKIALGARRTYYGSATSVTKLDNDANNGHK